MKRSEAKNLGLVRYEADKPCPKCGSMERRVCSGGCPACQSRRQQEKEKTPGTSRHTARLGRGKRARANYKAKVFDHYGRACSRCGFDDMRALTIDHVDQGGFDHKRSNGKRFKGAHLYRWLVWNGFPMGFRTLCCNCQSIVFAEHEGRNENNMGGIREKP